MLTSCLFLPFGAGRDQSGRRDVEPPAGSGSLGARDDRVKRGRLRETALVGEWTARGKAASPARREHGGCTLWTSRQLGPERIGIRRRGDQQLRIRVSGMLGHLFGRPPLDDLAGVHDEDLIGEVARRGDVVGDVEHREREAAAQLLDQVQHLEPDRYVEH